MKIAVISGSPKGRDSATLRYVRFLQLNYPQVEFQIEHVGQQIGKLEKNKAFFDSLIDRIKEADAVLWATPVYYLVVPSQLKRFIELVFERDKSAAFSDKPAASLTTSIHFFDHTAVRYLHAVSEDLGMHYGGSYTAEMNDLRRPREKRRLLSFGKIMLACFEKGFAAPYCRTYPPSPAGSFVYQPEKPGAKIDPAGKKIVIVADLENTSANLAKMVEHFRESFTKSPELINLAERNIKLGCRGCLACGAENHCFYEKRDSFRNLFEDKVKKAHILIIAGEIKDRFLSARIKRFMDRSFYMNHVP
ncbi:MAG: NAD(P)H-dependent oxidoreductase, partial [Bacillota bacterium]